MGSDVKTSPMSRGVLEAALKGLGLEMIKCGAANQFWSISGKMEVVRVPNEPLIPHDKAERILKQAKAYASK